MWVGRSIHVALLGVAISGCAADAPHPLVGTWLCRLAAGTRS
jgi:hypothetical protein